MCKGGEPQPFPHLANGFRVPRLGETIEVQISAIEGADILFDHSINTLGFNRQRQKHVLYTVSS